MESNVNISEVSLIDTLSEPTQQVAAKGPDIEIEQPKAEPIQPDFDEPLIEQPNAEPTQPDFDEPLIEQPKAEPTEPEEEKSKVSPEVSAQTLIEITNVTQSSILMPIAAMKIKKRIGKDSIKKMEAVLVKEYSGEKLSAEEKALMYKQKKFEASLKILQSEIPFTEQDKADMMPLFTSLCERNNWSVHEGWGIGAVIMQKMVDRVVKVIAL